MNLFFFLLFHHVVVGYFFLFSEIIWPADFNSQVLGTWFIQSLFWRTHALIPAYTQWLFVYVLFVSQFFHWLKTCRNNTANEWTVTEKIRGKENCVILWIYRWFNFIFPFEFFLIEFRSSADNADEVKQYVVWNWIYFIAVVSVVVWMTSFFAVNDCVRCWFRINIRTTD